MTIAGVGVDVIDVRRIERLRAASGARFTRRWFTPAEITEAESTQCPAARYAALLAVKEAVWKAMGVQTPSRHVPWQSICVLPGTEGEPVTVTLTGELQAAAATAQLVSLSAEYSLNDQLVIAFAIAETS